MIYPYLFPIFSLVQGRSLLSNWTLYHSNIITALVVCNHPQLRCYSNNTYKTITITIFLEQLLDLCLQLVIASPLLLGAFSLNPL